MWPLPPQSEHIMLPLPPQPASECKHFVISFTNITSKDTDRNKVMHLSIKKHGAIRDYEWEM